MEFKGPETIAELYPEGVRLLLDGGHWRTLAGQPTDDSEMALALARSIVQAGGYDAEAAASAYAWWFSTGPYDYGNATEQALRPAIRALQTGRPVARAAREAANTATQPNGSLMRVSPIGIVCAALPPGTAAQWAREDATLTHPDPVCQDASAVFAETVAYAIRTGPEPSAAYEYALQIAAQSGVSPVIGEVLDRARDVPPTGYAGPSRGWVLVAFQNAFYQLLHAPSLEEGVVDSVMRGGDTDTNAAIAGALLGATYGRDAVPFQWLDRVLTCRPLAGLPGVVHPRPQAFWPVDALWLAELLVTAGPDTTSPND